MRGGEGRGGERSGAERSGGEERLDIDPNWGGGARNPSLLTLKSIPIVVMNVGLKESYA